MRILKYTVVGFFAITLYAAAYNDATQDLVSKAPLKKVKLKFEIKRTDGTPVKGAIISLALTHNDFDVAKYIAIKTTTEDGCTYFKRLKPAEYYYQLDAIDITPFHKEGTIKISEAMTEFTETIIIVPDTAKL
jgi:predicted membrane protein